VCHCSSDYNPPSVFNQKDVKARKPHKCSECYRVIAIGETYRNVFGVWDGSSETFFWCAHCDAAQSIVEAATDCHCYLFGALWEDFRETAELSRNKTVQRIYHNVRRQWTYRRGPKKGQLVPVPVALTLETTR
jgi:hypothetical protein